MAERAEALVLQMSADIRRMEKALAKIAGDADRQLGRTEKRFDKLNQHIQRSGDQMARDLRAAFATIGVGLAIREVSQAADQWTNLRNSVSQYTGVVGPAEQATARLLGVANDAGVAITSLGTTFAASARAAKTLGASADQVFAFNEAVAKGAQIANTGAAAVDGALTQLGQAISSPKVQLGEFNSVIEGTPRLAQAFADGIKEAGGSVATLRELISKGEISGGELFQGLISELPTLRREFAATDATISRSVNRLNNAFLEYVGNADKATNGTKILNGFLNLVAGNFDLLADAAIVAATAIGGTLAVQAIGRFIAEIRKARTSAKEAGVEFLTLRTAMSFLGGPWGAAIIGIAAALGSLAFSTLETASAADRAADAFQKIEKVSADVAEAQAQLTAAQERLTEATRKGGEAARIAGVQEVERLRNVYLASKTLLDLERAKAAIAVADRSREFQTQRVKVPAFFVEQDINRGAGMTLRDQFSQLGLPELMKRGQSGAEFISEMAIAAQTRALTAQESALFAVVSAGVAYDEEMRSLTERLKELNALSNSAPGAGSEIPFPEIPERAGGASGLRGYATELEKVTDTIKALREEATRDAKLVGDSVLATQSLLLTDQTADDFTDKWRAANDKLAEVYDQTGDRTLERSRVALEALIAFMDSTSVRAAFDQLPNLSDVLLGDDVEIFKSEAAERVQAAADALATGVRKLEIDRDADIAKINQAMLDATGLDAAAIDAMSASERRNLDEAVRYYLAKIHEAHAKFQEGAAELANAAFKIDFSGPDIPLPAGSDPVADVLAFNTAQLTAAGIFPSEAQEEFRELMRNSVKQAMREGIRTGDWDEAFRSILADAVTSGLEGALNRVGDWLADFLFAPDGFLGGLINGAGAWVGANIFGGTGRPTGGGVMAGGAYRVNDRADNGEFLFMGSNAGQVLRAADINGMLNSRNGNGTIIQVGLTVMGSIDAVTWPKVQAAMNAQSQRIMAAMPTAVRGTIIHDRKQKRRY